MGMSEIFTHVAPVMPRRQFDPFVVHVGAATAIFVTFLIGFSTFVVSHEHAADARRAAAQSAAVAEAQARAAALASPRPDPALARLMDGDARAAADRALQLAARSLAASSSWTHAEATDLARQPTTYLFVDGPSSSPDIVSVHVAGAEWGAAVLGTSGACYWVSASTTGSVRYGMGRTCTGQAALGADRASWSMPRTGTSAVGA
jgi:hypothetical protein